jgi:hypothetical protein
MTAIMPDSRRQPITAGQERVPCSGTPQGEPDSLAAARFARRGLPGLIARPSAEPVFDAALLGAHRPPWTPHDDPRLDALADAFARLLNTGRASAAAPTATLIDMIKELPR